jgi:hypothetical protein
MLIFISVCIVLIVAYNVYSAVISYKEDDTLSFVANMIFAALLTICTCLCIMPI